MNRSGLVTVFCAMLFACDENEPRPPKHSGEIYVSDARGASSVPTSERYAYVARRSLAAIGLAEARGMDADSARAAVDHAADALDACVTAVGSHGSLAEGAARMVVQFGVDGAVSGATLTKVEPETGPVVATAKLCFEARVKLMAIAPGDAGARAMAIEAMWGAFVPRTKTD